MNTLLPQLLPTVTLAAAGLAAFGAYSIFAPGSQVFGPVVSRAPRGGARGVAITFDDGPCPGTTEPILDALEGAGVRAAFFLIGANAQRWPALVRRIDAAGHMIGNHSYEHSWLGPFRWRRYWHDQLVRTDGAIADAIGRRPRLFRPPMGIKTTLVAAAARSTGHTVVTWTRRAFDGVPTTPPRILARLVPRAQAGEILLLHDGTEPRGRHDRSATVGAMRPLLTGLRERGLDVQRLDHLIGLEPYAT